MLLISKSHRDFAKKQSITKIEVFLNLSSLEGGVRRTEGEKTKA